ncbi:hypothetical protein DQ04_02311040 [Trypanosoma grayi]|uniref:hypothetical protein n=1 Tax=Trypanosoma grayi TaxID=71804 RepID=UPI0004F41138|nr:hypothetical protein DQ04_02311040 [Trypanosoma grayi]KEG11752.1 hypothetical protein DQ04_02311040 [Trypanosoma grayi]
MFQWCGIWLKAGSRSGTPNMGKLLYGRRKNALHTTSKAKPSVVGMLLQVPMAELRQAARRAAGMRELNKDTLAELLKKCRAVNRLDRAEVVVEVADEMRMALTSSHYCTLMAHANDNKDWQTALRYWDRACREKKTNEKLHGALLASYRAAGRWKDAVQHYNAMIEDKMVLEPYALHTVMNTCRKADAHNVALSTFSKAVSAGATPNSTVYLELLRCLQQARVPNRWKMSLSILNSLEGKVDMTAGLYNATMSTLGGAVWEKGVELFNTMKAKNVQPSKETLATLVALNPNNLSHTVQCIAEAHSLGMPVTDGMYRAVLANLLRLQLDHEAVRFAESEYSRCTADPGNPVNSSLALSLAIIDSLLAHSRPQEAVLFSTIFESRLGNVVGAATRGLGSIGLQTQRWIVQGRVAVVDHNVLLDPQFESLLSHYDSMLVPFSSVRLLVRRVREVAGTAKGRHTKKMLKRLQELATTPAPLRVLSLAHQLNAHTYIVDGPITKKSVELLRKAVREEESEKEQLKDKDAPLLIRRSDGLPSALERFDDSLSICERKEVEAMAATTIVKGDESSVNSNSRAALKNPERLTAPERVLAVAVMLKSLNPDASVHVVSPNPVQLQVVTKWNERCPATTLTAVRYPDEVSIKAPAEEQQQHLITDAGDEETLVKGERQHNRDLRPETRKLFVPS